MRKSLLAGLLGCAVVLFAPPLAGDGLPSLGEAAQAGFNPLQERRLGEAIMRDIRADPAYHDDAEITDYLNNLGYRLVAVSPDNSQDFEFFLVRDNTLNAFALPGGFIGVHTGLLLAAQGESELAGVLAHEVAHVTQRHLARMLAREQQAMLPGLAALAVAILAARSNPQLANAAIATSQASMLQNRLDFTREHEREADRVGIQVLADAGFDPRGMAGFFERLQRSTRVYENNAPEYLRTHPITSERIADVQHRATNMAYRQKPDSAEFHLVRAKLRAEAGTPRDAVKEMELVTRERKFGEPASRHYGLALALSRHGEHGRAQQEIDRARRLGGSSPMIDNLAARILLAAGRRDEALATWQAAQKTHPGYRALAYAYAEALLAGGAHEQALAWLQQQLRLYPGDARLHRLLARGHHAAGRVLAQHQALAEASALQGNYVNAIEHLQIGLRGGDGDFYQMSIAEARLRELRRIDGELRAEQNARRQ